ncbi:MAG: hypothetical protein ACERKN_03560 [Velocimicrobium sp.]
MKNKYFLFGFFLILSLSIFTGCGAKPTDNETSEKIEQEEQMQRESDLVEGNGLRASIQIGFEKFVKDGRYARVVVTIHNASADFSGAMYIGFPSGKIQSVVYQKDISIDAGTIEDYEMAVPMNLGGDEIEFSIKDEEDTQILSKTIKVNVAYNANLKYIGVLTDDTSHFASFVGKNVKLFFFSKEDFPENALYLDSLDAIVVDKYDVNILSNKQREVLDKFSKESSVITMDSTWNIKTDLEEKIIDNLSRQSKIRIEKETYGTNGNNLAYESVEIKDPEKVPCFFKYAIIIFLYLIIIGPPLYFFLKKIDKPGGIWLLVPALSVIFALIIYGIGANTRFTEPYVGYLTRVNIGTNETKEQVLFTLTSPYNTEYEVDIPKEYSVAAVNSGMGYMESSSIPNLDNEYTTFVDWAGEENRILVKDNAAFSSGYYKADRSLEYGGKLEGEVHISPNYRVDGTITNTTGYDLTNACLCVGDVYVILGDIKKGESRELEGLNQEILISSIALYQGKILEDLAGGNPIIDKREERMSRIYNAYQYFLEDRMSSFIKEDCELVGFAESEPKSEAFRDINYQKDGITMVTINGDVNYTSNKDIFIPNLDTYMKAEDTYYYDTYRYMSTDTMKFQIQFNQSDHVKELIYSRELNDEFRETSWTGFYGTIKAFNYQTQQYDVLFTGGQSKTVMNIMPYMSTTNSMLILVETMSDQMSDKTSTIPVLSAVKEAK